MFPMLYLKLKSVGLNLGIQCHPYLTKDTDLKIMKRQNTNNHESGGDSMLQNYCVTRAFKGRVHETAARDKSPSIIVDRSAGVLKPDL